MIIYGWRSTHTKFEPVPHEKCPSCGQEGSMGIHVLSKYAHIFWIPLFPYGRVGVAKCGNCGYEAEKSGMNDGLKREYSMMEKRHPLWTFSGLALITVFAGWMTVEGKRDTAREKEYIQSPQIGDVYEIRADKDFSSMKIIDIQDTNIMVVYNQYAINKMTKVPSIDKPENYKDTGYFTFGDIQRLYDEDIIFDVRRRKN